MEPADPQSPARQPAPEARPATSPLFGRTLKKRRKDLGITLEQLAEATGIHISTLSSVEVGRRLPPEYADVLKLAAALRWEEGGADFIRFLRLALLERTRRKKIRTRPAGALVLRRHSKREDAPSPAAQPVLAEPALTEPTSALLAKVLKQILEIELAEGIVEMRLTTAAGNDYTVQLR